jgi:hypothetical protein
MTELCVSLSSVKFLSQLGMLSANMLMIWREMTTVRKYLRVGLCYASNMDIKSSGLWIMKSSNCILTCIVGNIS